VNLLDRIERVGNRLPEPATLFLLATIAVMLCSALAVWLDWTLTAPIGDEPLQARSLLSSDGVWWLLSHLVENFMRFPPLAIVIVGMLGIGLAERSGLLPALFNQLARITPAGLLTPVMVFLGIQSSIALDAGYVVLPPLAAALYHAAGRSPLAGIAAVFAGVSAGFSANLLITGLDPMLAGFSESGASFMDPGYRVAVTANWWFMMVSAVLLTMVGWAVTAWYVEPRLRKQPGNAEPVGDMAESANAGAEQSGLRWAGAAFLILLILILLMALVPGAPLHGAGDYFPRWIEATVPLLFLIFFVPGLVFGLRAGRIRSDRDAVRMLYDTVKGLAPYIVLAFFAAQFVESFKYSGLGEMLAVAGGQMLTDMMIPLPGLVIGFVLVVALANLLIGSASAKYAFFAPIFVPMFMQVGISPELTQVSYRIGDSVSNVITPLNPYLIIIIAQVQRYASGSGFGTVFALMLPYSIVFLIVWVIMLLIWLATGLQLGPAGPLTYTS
jgi:aminobenzoyl-glutamate transport protein